MEDVAAALGRHARAGSSCTRPNDRELAESFVRRAEAAGFRGHRRHARHPRRSAGGRATSRSRSFPQLKGLCLANYFSDPVFRAKLAAPPEEDLQARHRSVGDRPSATRASRWDDLAWLRSLTDAAAAAQGHLPSRRRPPRRSTPASTASTARTTAVARPTAGCRRSTACPTSSTPPVTRRSSSTPACAAAPTSSRRSRSAPRAVGIGRPYAYGARRRRPGRHRARAAVPARRDRPHHGHRRLPPDRRSVTRRAGAGRRGRQASGSRRDAPR